MRMRRIVLLIASLAAVFALAFVFFIGIDIPQKPAVLQPAEEAESVHTAVITPVPAQQPSAIPEPMPVPSVRPTPEPSDDPVQQTAEPAEQNDSLAMEIFNCTNRARTNEGFGKLAYGYDLQDAADTRAYECSIQFSHTRPNGTSCHSIVEDFDYYVTGENLIMLDKPIALPEVIVSEWMLSEGHRHNILLSEFKELAVGVYEKDGVVYAVQIFMG